MDNPNFVLPDNRAALQISGYLPNGVRVFFTVNVDLANAYGEALDFTNRLLSQGFSTNAPGLKQGEDRFLAARVVKREKFDQRRNRNVVIIDLYTDHGKFRELGVYLNDENEEAAFEAAAGVKLAALPLCENEAPFKLDGDLSKANRYLRPLPQPLGVVREPNPGYVEGGDTKKSKWKFVRWDIGTAAPPASVPPVPPQTVNGNPPAADEGKLTVEQWNSLKNEFGADFVAQVLQVKKGSDWKGSYAAARETVLKHQVPF